MALKLDITKAYDRVSWKFLKHKMQAMNFSERWIKWIFLCVQTVSYQFCINGFLVGLVNPKRGLRQGDPLSPYIFLLCVEGLSNDLDRVVITADLHGSKIAPTTPPISHLLFADHSFLFFKGTNEEAHVSEVDFIIV